METVKSQQTNSTDEEKGQVSAQAEPKDKKRDHLDLGVADVLEIMSAYTPSFSIEILKSALNKMTEKAQEEDGKNQPTIDQQTQERIKAYYKNLDPKTKLAICTFSELECLDGINFQHLQKEGKLIDEIRSDLLDTCLEIYGDKGNEFWLAGVWETTRMILQNC